jgi:ABC-type sugar transport system ATPase subunit
VVSRALETHGLKALVLHDPTAGVDVGTRASILELLQKRAAAGLSVLLCSTDVDEVLAIASVVIVLSDGVVRRRLEGGEITADTIAQLIHSSEPPCHCS